MTVMSFLLLIFLSSTDYPVIESVDRVTLEELSVMDFEHRQDALLELNLGYRHLDNGSGPLQTVSIPGVPGDLVLIEVYRSLTPYDLAILDQAGLWPVGFAPSENAFVAVINENPSLSALNGSGFAKTITRWTWNNAIPHQHRNWSGSWLVKMAPGFEPPLGTALLDQWWLVANPVESGVVSALPDMSLNANSHSFNAQADDSRQVTGMPNLWTYYTGMGVRIGIIDTGVWSEHPDLNGTVVNGSSDSDGHGTAVCGVIASRGNIDLNCEYNGSGGAPGVQLYTIKRPDAMTPSQFAGFYTDLFTNDCFIVNNSWGFDGSTSYDGFCQFVDTYARNGTISIFSAGNSPISGAIPSPAIARNAITVGAVSFLPDSRGNLLPASYTGCGPTADGRLKPEILAPGGEFYNSTMQTGVATTNAQYGGEWLDKPENRWPGEPMYTRFVGTSMAAAFVSSALAICEEKYGELFSPEDAMAIMTACAIPLKSNTGDPLSGYATATSGFGLLDGYHLPGTYFSEEVDRLMWINSTIAEGTGFKQWTMYVPTYTRWISVGLGYTDVASASPEIQVDLDVTLISPSNVEYSYLLPAGVTAQSPFERIIVEIPESGAWTVRVTASSWSDPGDPSERQRFSIAGYRFCRDPELSIAFPIDTTIYAPPGGELVIPVQIINTGGYVAAGAWAKLSPPAVFLGNVNEPAFMGNLLYKDSRASTDFTLQCPDESGTYLVDVTAGAGNRGLADVLGKFTIVLAYPDLSVSVASPDVSPPFQVGQVTGFSVVVSNDGDGPSPATQLAYYLTDDPDSLPQEFHLFDVPRLESGERTSFKTDYRFTYFDMGSRYIVAEIDPYSNVVENDETNNSSVYGSFSVNGDFAPPQNLVAVSGNNGFIPLSWEPPDVEFGSRGLVRYRVYRSVNSLAPEPEHIAEFGAETVAWTDSQVVNGVGYYYWATCVYTAPSGESEYSNMASATAQGPTGSLGGIVSDTYTGQLLKDIQVVISGLGVTAVTDNTGYYYFDGVPVGDIPLYIDHEPYLLFSDTVIVTEDSYTEFDIGLIRNFSQGMTVLPTPFTPNGDGVNDVVSFVWPAANGAAVNLIIMNIEGVPVREITDSEPKWDGRDNMGYSLLSGIYIFHASAPVGEVTGTVCIAR